MKKIHNHNESQQNGAVSLFIVVFTALLITTITISFMQVMMRDQQQATYSDLSESAYDSAMAGVEDAKRLLLLDNDCRNGSAALGVDCVAVETALMPSPGQNQTGCDTLVRGGIVGQSGNETIIQQEVGDGADTLDQAYTCIKIAKNTGDYLGSIDSDASATLVPLRATDPFNKIVISWGLSKSGGTVDLTTNSRELPVLGETSWPETRPALLRTQLINGRDSFRLADFDTSGFSNTLFMYPSATGSTTAQFALDGRRGALAGEPQLVSCQPTVSSGAYACSVTIDVDPVVNARSQTAFLNLVALYNRTDYKIELLNGSTPVLFDSVQPEVDSTGRANDLFRRVVSRVELNNTFNYPVAALETRHNICKNFSVTTDPADFVASPQCRPIDD